MLKSKIKPGDLVKGLQNGRKGTALAGIIIKESDRTNHWVDKAYFWWWILTNEGNLIEEVEGYFEKICE